MKVLIVEDDEAIANLLYMDLSDEGYDCTCVYNGKTAADLLEAGIPAALLDRGLRWEAESGTVVVLTLDAAPVGGEAAALLTRLHSRNQLLGALAGELVRLCPGMEVRALAGYILLTPTPAATSDPPPAAPGGAPDSGRSR